MAYWRKWKSLIGGGIGFFILGIFMFVLLTIYQNQPGRIGGGGSIGNQFTLYGVGFIVIGVIMLILGYLLRKEPAS
jgi:Na+/melibiose symporter-like transporter